MNDIVSKVVEFYDQLPFNFAGTIEKQVALVAESCQISVYQPLHTELTKAATKTRVLDVGCGAGWFALSVAHWYGLSCHGIDFTETALNRARAGCELLDLNDLVTLSKKDILHLPDGFRKKRFNIVNSIGVLHHTADCRQAFFNIAELLENGGFMHVGLYHKFGRKPLLNTFASYKKDFQTAKTEACRKKIEDEGFALWKRVTSNETLDETFSRSWYRDQCLHPHETQWLLADVLEWFSETDIEPNATSLNRYEKVHNWRTITENEPIQEKIAESHMANNRYFPGFFMVSGRKK